MPINPLIISGGLKLLGGLFGGRDKTPPPMTPQESILSTARGVTKASKAYGINRLTLLGASNATAGAGMSMGSGSPSPLASLSLLGDIVEEGWGQEAEQRREHNRLQNELLRLEVDRTRSIMQVPRSAVADVGPSPSLFGGNNTGTIATGAGVSAGPFSVLRSDQKLQTKPTEDLSGFMRFRNGFTDNDGFFVPGSDGEPLSIGQVPVVAGAWAASEAIEFGSKIGTWLRDSPSSPIRRTDFKDNDLPIEQYLKKYPYGRDAYGSALPKPN